MLREDQETECDTQWRQDIFTFTTKTKWNSSSRFYYITHNCPEVTTIRTWYAMEYIL